MWQFLTANVIPFAAALPILIAFLVQVLYKHSIMRQESLLLANEARPSVTTPDWEHDTRIAEARRALQRQDAIAAWNERTVNLLTVGQFIIGGALATWIVQPFLSPGIVGFLGVLVVASSVIHQRFRPDLRARNAAERTVDLRLLVRKAEDMVFEMKRQNSIEGIPMVRQMISDGLNSIEKSEFSDLNNRTGGFRFERVASF
jgi:hypothetical protein